MSCLQFQTENTTQAPPTESELRQGYVLKAPHGTDLWAKPPSTYRSNAPTVYKAIPLKSFVRARVRIMADYTRLYDQGGLVLILHRPGECGTGSENDITARKWVKTGVEFVDNHPHVSTVTKDRWADWSLVPTSVLRDGIENGVVIEMVREKGALWVYVVLQNDNGEKKLPLREVTWVFSEEDRDVEAWIGMYACRPAKEGGPFAVTLKEFELELNQE